MSHFTIQHPKKSFEKIPAGQSFVVEIYESEAHVPEHVTATNATKVAAVSLPRDAIIAAAGPNDAPVTAVLQFDLSVNFKLTVSIAYHIKGQKVPQWTPLFEANLLDKAPLAESKYSTILPAPTLQQQKLDTTERLIARAQYIAARYEQWKQLPKHNKYITKNSAYMGPLIADTDAFITANFGELVTNLPNPYAGTNLDKAFAVPAKVASTTQLEQSLHTLADKIHDILHFRKFTPAEAKQEIQRRARSGKAAAAAAAADSDSDLDLDLDMDDDELDLDLDMDDLDIGGDDDDDDLDLDLGDFEIDLD